MTHHDVTIPGAGIVTFDDACLADARARIPGGTVAHHRAWAAAHVVLRSSYAHVAHTEDAPGTPEEIAGHIDWDATDRIRDRLTGFGFGIAEAMDTAQRYEVGWTAARTLIERAGRRADPLPFIAGAGTDQRPRIDRTSDLVDAVCEQTAFIVAQGGIPMILAMPGLALQGADEATYVDVYRAIIDGSDGPLLIHWLGPMFLPALEGYFPGDAFLRIMRHDPSKVRGAKLSLMDAPLERRLRRELSARDQLMLTGDDFDFGSLMIEDGAAPQRDVPLGPLSVGLGDFSHGLLGILDAVAAPARVAFDLAAAGHVSHATELLAACEVLGRTIFERPTRHYKAGLAFLAWLNGWQDERTLVNHVERSRDKVHYARVARDAARAGAIIDATIAAQRARHFFA